MGDTLNLALEYYRRFEAGDIDGAAELFDPGCLTHLPLGTLSAEEHRVLGHAFKDALPDAGMTVVSAVEAGDRVALQGRFHGTHTVTLHTPQGDIPAQGRRIDMPFGDFFRVSGGRFVEHAVYWDTAGMLAQLGAGAPAGHRALVERAVELVATGRLDRLGEVAHADFTFVLPGVVVRGLDQVRPFWEGYRRAFSDLRHELASVVESGDALAVRMRVTGTHDGPLATPQGEIAPTGNPIVLESVDWITVRDGRLATWEVSYDPAALLAQLGLAPADAASVG